jgi:DNA-binding LacI/PurR family transcriptional regulator
VRLSILALIVSTGSKVIGIKDVARAAGVSTTTVSHALSGKGRLPEETRVRVRHIADELGYRPNAVARSLAEGRTGVIGSAFSIDVRSGGPAEISWYGAVLNAAAEHAKRLGYALVFVPYAEGSDMWSKLPLDGSIIVEPVRDDPHLAALRERHVPWVAVGRPYDGEGWFVDNDNGALVRGVFDHLRAGGATRTALLTVEWPSSWQEESIESYQVWCASRGQTPAVVVAPSSDPAAAIAELMDRPERPDAVFCLFETVAVGLVEAARERGIRIPEDLLIVAGGDIGVGEHAHPAITTIDYDAKSLGATAVEMLIDQIEGTGSQVPTRFLPTRLVPRASSSGLSP